MKRKFVQIAAFILALSILPSSFAAEADGDAAAQQNILINIEDESSVSDVLNNDTNLTEDDPMETDGPSDPAGTEPDGSESEPGPGETGLDNEATDPEQEITDPDNGHMPSSDDVGNDSEQGPSDPDDGGNDPEQGTTGPDGEEFDPEQGSEEPVVPEIIVPVLETEEETGATIRVGLSYGSNALTSANLLNAVGSGYRFGFHEDNVFNQVGYTPETKISVLKTQNLYYTSTMPDGYSGYGATETSGPAVGCVHLQLPGTYSTFTEAKTIADALGGFPAWINGEFVVRFGTFLTADAARAAQTSEILSSASVVGTSEYGFIVVVTGTNTPVFQYDGGSEHSMFVVKPGLDNSVKAVTYYKGIKYYGSFRYERLKGENITVVSLVDIDDYVRGVIPYEMSPSWPLEALKAQAVAARSYAVANTNSSHTRNGFDVCTSTCCQVYFGIGGATAHTDRAVDETAGLYAWYGNEPILAVFHASSGGATENCENVWNEALPYLRGVIDPYEILAADKNPYDKWTKTYTGNQLKDILNSLGYGCSEIVDVLITPSQTGNVQSITFVDSNAKKWTLSKYKNVKTNLAMKSMRYTVSYDGNDYALTEDQTVGSLQGIWVLNGAGELVQINTSPVYAMTADGVTEVPGSNTSGRTFVFNGGGNGHNLGLSQWGAYAMANEGFTYDQILKFYFTGIEIHE